MNKRFLTWSLAVVVGVAWLWSISDDEQLLSFARPEPVTPNWAAIGAWPMPDPNGVEALPDPNRRITAIVLDDSGSMGTDIEPAKQAVIGTLEAMNGSDRVAILALNAGTVLPFTSVEEARINLPSALGPISSTGSTPLTQAVRTAQILLEQEAGRVRGFGTYRVIITTDGKADDGQSLVEVVKALAATTPIQITTIGIDISGNHVLRRSDLASFVDVANVGALQAALQAAVAENADFTAITDFTATGE